MTTTRFTIAPGFAGLLRAAGLDGFERAMAAEAPPSAVTRAVPGRSTVRIDVPAAAAAPAGGPPGVLAAGSAVLYLKRYRGAGARAAAREWRALAEVAAAGIPCPERVALGERCDFLGPRASCLVTLGIAGGCQADWWVRDHPDRRRDLAEGVAGLARRFHDAGFHHRDLYLCHFFVVTVAGRKSSGGDEGPPPLDLFLIDLQRCARLGLLRRRWLVKDLAQLHHSFAAAGLGSEDWDVFIARYGLEDRGLRRAVLRKSARIARHVPRYG